MNGFIATSCTTNAKAATSSNTCAHATNLIENATLPNHVNVFLPDPNLFLYALRSLTCDNAGDWEIDTVLGKTGQSVLVTAVDRKSRYLIMRLATRKTSEAVIQTLLKMYHRLKRRVHTITCDNGTEFAQHRILAKKLKADIYLCTPYHSWERGTNENTNGLIRQYFPKSTNFDLIKPIEVKRIMDKLNRRPRKILNFNTPRQVFLND